jgi:hypothetical protein
MTRDEFDRYRRRTIRDYAAEHVRAGNWSQEEAERRAAKETDDLLPDGVDSTGMTLLVAEADGVLVGLVWLGRAPASESAGGSTTSRLFSISAAAAMYTLCWRQPSARRSVVAQTRSP